MNNIFIKDGFRFKEFWIDGGFQTKVELVDDYLTLKDYITRVQRYNLGYNETIPVLTADWDVPFYKKEKPPQIYTDFIKSVLTQKVISEYQNIYGKFTYTKLMLHKTPKGYINEFHSHTYDGAHMHLLFHFSEQERFFEDGGLIQVGEVIDKKNVIFNDYDFYHTSPRSHKPSISTVCNTGLLTVVNNINPFFRHSVTEVLTAKSRYTLMLALGYTDNIQKRNIRHI